jgi:hypothetical protein
VPQQVRVDPLGDACRQRCLLDDALDRARRVPGVAVALEQKADLPLADVGPQLIGQTGVPPGLV